MLSKSFPYYSYLKHQNNIPANKFSIDAVIAICLNAFLLNILTNEIFDMICTFKQSFKYYLSDFEIKFLAKLAKSELKEIFKQKFYNIDYHFCLNLYKKKYIGLLNISIKFINKRTLEKSYFLLNFEILPQNDLKIFPFFLNYDDFKQYLQEFFQKIFVCVFSKIKNINTKILNIKSSNFIKTPQLVINLDSTNIFKNLRLNDLTIDVFLILNHLYNIFKTKDDLLFISTDDILEYRNLKKNPNSLNIRSGYKKHERLKIHKALYILSIYKLIELIEVKNFQYCINLSLKTKTMNLNIISSKLVQYNIINQKWNKRFGLFLSLAYTNNQKKILVKDLIDQIDDISYSFKPMQLRDKFENTLDELVDDKIIKFWQYFKINEKDLQNHFWLEKWKLLKIVYEI